MSESPTVSMSPPLSAGQIFFRYWLPVVLYALLILYLSSLPIKIRQIPFRNYDKVFHMMEYGLFALLWYRAIRVTGVRVSFMGPGVLTFLVCALFGVLDEIYQIFTPYRISDLYDVAADSAGSLFGVIAAVFRDRMRRR